MNALLQPLPRLLTMQLADLDQVLQIEHSAYGFPWTRGNFVDSLAAGYLAEALALEPAGLIGYYVALPGVGEMHLLNLTVAPAQQRCGHARTLLDALQQRCRERRLQKLWLEVRAGNARARQVYAARGFAELGLRRGYYPAAKGRREDAIVMCLELRDA
ncbi:MAG TPA: ribosomal protein S18-alanine N-acetyltransferase [Rubrivivax sp.]|nr:ribosomal protein S18-alanine N-acetyltransferase [Rubrivivax sp.]